MQPFYMFTEHKTHHLITYLRGKHPQHPSQVPKKQHCAPINEVAHRISSKEITLSPLEKTHLIVASKNCGCREH